MTTTTKCLTPSSSSSLFGFFSLLISGRPHFLPPLPPCTLRQKKLFLLFRGKIAFGARKMLAPLLTLTLRRRSAHPNELWGGEGIYPTCLTGYDAQGASFLTGGGNTSPFILGGTGVPSLVACQHAVSHEAARDNNRHENVLMGWGKASVSTVSQR